MSVSMSGDSIRGTRENQEDYYVYRDADGLAMAVVCDGMGGLLGGEIASKTAVLKFKEDVKKAMPIADYPSFLEEEALQLDEAIFSLTDDRGNHLDCGTTIVSILIEENRCFFLTVGDSRILICRGEEMMALNREHNYRLQLDYLKSEGKIGKEAYEEEDKRGEQLISYLGMGGLSITDINHKPFCLEDGDTILLCSDGVTKTLSEEEIHNILKTETTPKSIVKNIRRLLVDKKKRHQDNATFLVVKYTRGEKK